METPPTPDLPRRSQNRSGPGNMSVHWCHIEEERAMAVETSVTLSDRVRRYLEVWHSLDPVRVSELYADDATHRGPGVVMFYPDLPDATLFGNDAIAKFAERARDVVGGEATSDFVVTRMVEAGEISVVEYDMRSEAGTQPWVEIVEWSDDHVRQVHVYLLPNGS
jgi:SnoaL-like domain